MYSLPVSAPGLSVPLPALPPHDASRSPSRSPARARWPPFPVSTQAAYAPGTLKSRQYMRRIGAAKAHVFVEEDE